MNLKHSTILILTGSQSAGLGSALTALHGVTKKVGEDENKKPIMELVPYEFKLGARLSLAQLAAKLAPHADTYEKTRAELIKDWKNRAKKAGAELNDKWDKWEEFTDAATELLEHEVDVGKLPKIDVADLEIDKNKLPAGVVVALMPFLSNLPALAE